MRIACYLRVSTGDGRQTVESQRLAIKQYCERQAGWKIVKEYCDDGYSGSRTDRPEFNLMMKDALAQKFDSIVTFSVDRLGRSTVDLLQTLNTLQAVGVGFCAISQGIDLNTAAGRMLASFLSILAQWEKETIIERVKMGIQRAKEQGVRFGRPRSGFDVHKALELKRNGKSWNDIAKSMAVSKATIRRTLTPLLKTQPFNMA
jgi:DNA invertase Pin-like site-specific DNA recombinase